MQALQDGEGGRPLREVATTDVATTGPDATLHDALALMLRRGIGRLPVVAPGEERSVIGYLGRADILAARMRQHDEERLREKGPRRATKSGAPRG